jgi:hypothetical protein
MTRYLPFPVGMGTGVDLVASTQPKQADTAKPFDGETTRSWSFAPFRHALPIHSWREPGDS